MPDNDIGDQIADDRRGWLMFESLPDDLRNAEDATLAADHERIREGMFDVFDRPATVTERTLLSHLGYTLAARVTTRVRWLSNGLRSRRWPTLENGS
jgi:hypothetical protein